MVWKNTIKGELMPIANEDILCRQGIKRELQKKAAS